MLFGDSHNLLIFALTYD